MIGRKLGRFRILEEIGAGGMGIVYRARDERLERDVALKVLPPGRLDDEDARKRFIKEAKALSKLNHPHIATIHDFDSREGVDFLVMEHIVGETLEDQLARGALEEADVLRTGIEIAEGLAAAHDHGVVHRDLKPSNIRLTTDGRVKILDFGLALLLEPASHTATTDSRVTQAQAVVGTLPYMAPEQLRGESADARTDLYAAGAVLYETATGRHVFPETRTPALIAAILNEPPTLPREVNPGISRALEQILVRALSKERDDRFQTASELVAALREPSGTESAQREAPLAPFPFSDEEAPSPRPVFVAREDELASLSHALEATLAGRGRVVFVAGEAGTGKTALVTEFLHRAQDAHADLVVASGNCNAHTGVGDPYLPMREVLAELTGDVEARWAAGSITKEHALRLWHLMPFSVRAILESGADLIDSFVAGESLLVRAQSNAPAGTDWLSRLREVVDRHAAHPAAPSPPQSVLFEQYRRVLHTLAREKPLLVVLDDLQWADAGSLGLLLHLAQGISSHRLLIVGTYRSDEVALGRDGRRHPLKPIVNELKETLGEIEVELGQANTLEFVGAYLDSEPNVLGASFREALYQHTKGHALFTTEVLRGMQARGALVKDEEGRWVESEELSWEALPARLEAMIGERIERLPERARKALATASVEGEVFTVEVLAQVLGVERRELVELLSEELDRRHRLVRALGVRRVDGARLSQYRFRHILFQKYLYGRLDDVARAYCHEDVGKALEERFGDRASDIAVQLAHHFQEAGLLEKALDYLGRAGERAVRISANVEAIGHFQRALPLLETMPESQERAQRELTLQLGLVAPLVATGGYGTREVFETAARARELCEHVGETPQLLQTLGWLTTFHQVRADYEAGFQLTRQFLQLAQSLQDPLSVAVAHWLLGYGLLLTGEFAEARDHLEHMVTFYRRGRQDGLEFIYPVEPGVAALTWSAHASWLLGYPDQALARSREALSLARDLDHPLTRVFALMCAGDILNLYLRDIQTAKRSLEESIPLAEAQAFPFWMAFGIFSLGYVSVSEGHSEEGVEKMNEGIAIFKATGSKGPLSILLGLLADAYVKVARAEEGLKILSDALAHVEESNERKYDAELHRLQGELLAIRGADDREVEACYLRSIDVAREQQAKSWELRATMSLARLWRKQRKNDEARERLAEIYGWFTEGFETPDLIDARALLDRL